MRSMTGFGKAESTFGNSAYTFEIKSVNHRFFDSRFRLPSLLSQYEYPLTEILRSHFERGSFEVNCKSRLVAKDGHVALGTRFVVDEAAAKSLVEGCNWLHQNFQTERIPTLETFAMTNRVFLPVEESQDSSGIWEPLKTLFEKAVLDLKKMREVEGKRICDVLKTGVETIESHLKELEKLAPEQPRKIKEKLDQRLQAWQLSTPIDSSRLEWEVAVLADKADIHEEMDRLKMHAKEYLSLLQSPKPIGRKLDFLTQELHREANTIASKANLIDITRVSVELKTQIERLREQVQNVE